MRVVAAPRLDLARLQTDPADFPGTGRGLLAWQLDGVGYGQESVTLIAYDARGMAEAVGSFYEAVSGLRALTKWVLPASNSVTPAGKAPTPAPEGTVAWKALLPDRAVAVKALPSGGVVVLTQDGSLTALNAQGKVEWQKVMAGGEAWALDASADGSIIVVGASQRLLGYSGQGKPLFAVPLTTDKAVPVVTFVAVSPDGKHFAAGAGNGRLTLLQADGKRLWEVGGVNPADKKAQPNPYLSGIFNGAGASLVALTQNEAHVIGLADGKVGARLGGVNGNYTPRRNGAVLLLSDGNSALVYVPAQNKVVSRINLPNVGVADLAFSGDHLVVGGEIDGVVRRVKATAEARGQTAWENRTPGRIVKHLAARESFTAVAYWGGLVRIFDRAGAVKAARVFPQDVAALTWSGTNLVVGLADGRVLALRGK